MYPHLGGTEGEERLANEIHDMWKGQGLDHVTKVDNNRLLLLKSSHDIVQIV